MNFFKRLPWVTILVTAIGIFYFKDDVQSFLEKKVPSLAKALTKTKTP